LVTDSEENSLDSEKRKTLGSQGACDVLVFPEMIRYLSLSQNEIQDLIKEHLIEDSVLSKVDHQKLDKKAYIFICGHVKRDKRCGVTGPLLVEEFQRTLKAKGLENQVLISQVSHIGGHKYAGNVIIYPGGVWYGRVIPCHVEAIVEKHINQGKILKKIFRGQMDPSDTSKIKNLNW